MAIEEAVRTWMLNQATITALVETRIFPDALPQKIEVVGSTVPTPLPALTYEIISTDEAGGQELSQKSCIQQSRIQFVAYADRRTESNAVIRAIRNSGIDRLKGLTFGVDIRGVQVESGIRHFTEAPADSTQHERYLSEIDLMFQYLGD